jgi:hypothetical protein
MDSRPIKITRNFISGFLDTHMSTHNRTMCDIHYSFTKGLRNHYLLEGFPLGTLVRPIQNSVLSFKGYLLVTLCLSVSHVSVFL